MAEFQWQNENLLKTIYPLREMKLRDFLLFNREVEIWAQYKGKTTENFKADIERYVEDRRRSARQEYDRYTELENYLLTQDVSEYFCVVLMKENLDPDADTLRYINTLHKQFATYYSDYADSFREKYFTSERIRQVEERRRTLKLRSRGVTTIPMKMLEEELRKLYRFLTGLQDLERFKVLPGPGSKNRPTWTDAKKQRGLLLKMALNDPQRPAVEAGVRAAEEAFKQHLVSDIHAGSVRLEDLAREKVALENERLQSLGHQQLLEEISRRFVKQPEKYPLWLQYMVVHFSGMRYRSAHGTFADPRELLHSLRIREIELEVRSYSFNDVLALCELRSERYKGALALGGGADLDAPPLAITSADKWRKRVDGHLRRLDRKNGYWPYTALTNLYIDEEEYRIEQLKSSDITDELKNIKERLGLPDDMWNKIRSLTPDLRKEIQEPDWESTKTQAQYKSGLGKFREILANWSTKDITAWRQAHANNLDLVVTSAVCNEVAEHIQHLRGREPSGGLTSKPIWYTANGTFKKIQNLDDLKPGASIFWLRWVPKPPNQWQVARPIKGVHVIPLGGDNKFQVDFRSNMYVRKRLGTPDGEGTEYLRWMHEATMVFRGDTADGDMVFTFETALPDEDKSQATIGLFKRRASSLIHRFNPTDMMGTFVGYVEPGPVPLEGLKDKMLNWNKILGRRLYSDAELEAYWQKLTRQ